MVVRPVKAVDFTAVDTLGARLEPPSRGDALTAARGGASRRRTAKQLPKQRHTRLSVEDVERDEVFNL